MKTRISVCLGLLSFGLLLTLPRIAKSQNQVYIDSLKRELTRTITDTSRANLLVELSSEYWETSPDTAQLYAEKALALASQLQFTKAKIGAYNSLGIINENKGFYTIAIDYYKQGLQLAQESHTLKNQAVLNGNIGELYRVQGKYPEALTHQLQSLKLNQQVGNKRGEAIALNNLGTIYGAMNQPRRSLGFHFASLRIKLAINNKIGAAISYSNIASDYIDLVNYTAALKYAQKALDLREQIGNLESIGDTYSHIGTIYLKKAEQAKEPVSKATYFQDALQMYQLALRKAQETTNPPNEAYSLSDIGRAYYESKNYYNAEKYLLSALAIADTLKNLELQSIIHSRLFDVYNATQQATLALKHYTKHIAARDSISNKENTEKLVRTQLEYEFDKERELSTQQQEAELQSRNLILLSLGFGLTMMGVIAFLLYRRSVFTKKVQQQTQRNLEEKEVLLREIHHRVKNNLAVISGLLYLQKNRVDDETIKGVLLEGQNRIDSMVLVHEMLYQSNNIAEIDLKSYLEKLIGQIAAGFQGKSLSYTIEGSASLEPKQAVPLGLILTELITNIYKYAYPDQQRGSFQLHIDRKTEQQLSISLSDKGKGLPAGFDASKSKTLGLKLVNLLCQQMKALLTFSSIEGTQVNILFQIRKGEDSL